MTWPCLVLAAAVQAADGRPADPARSPWAWRRDVHVPGGGELAALDVPLDVARRSRPELEDLRLVATDGSEVPYVVERSHRNEGEVASTWPGRLVDHRRETRRLSSWTVDLGETRTFDRIELDIPATDFAKRLHVESSADGTAWTTLDPDAGVFDRHWGWRVHHAHVALAPPATARWLRLTADDGRSRPIEVTGVRVVATRAAAVEEWREPFAATRLESSGGATRYRLDVAAGTPVRVLALDADEPAFARQVTVYDRHTASGQPAERVLAEKRVYRMRLSDPVSSAEDLRLELVSPPLGRLEVVVQDGDSPPVRGLRGHAMGPMTRLVFPATTQPLVLYYGNPVTRAPVYDLESLRARLPRAAGLPAARVGPESRNPGFAPPPPLPMVAPIAAAVEASRWRWRRTLHLAEREDIFTLALSAQDLAAARPDLGDLRVVDEQDRQVPFVLAAEAREERVGLDVEPMPSRAGDPRQRRLRLLPPRGSTPEIDRLPVQSLELDVAESFFSRSARVYAPVERGEREARLLGAATLSRRQDEGGACCSIALGGGPHRELWLEIDEGDNAPLTLREVRAVVKVPRVVLKARPGRYELLLGNPEAAPPRYDLATLRHEVLAYSATPASPGPLEPSPRYRRRGRDLLVHAPQAWLLWGTLAAAVAALLFLTVRILKSPAAPGSP